MSIPLLARYARRVMGEAPQAPGEYDEHLGYRVVRTPDGTVPVVKLRGKAIALGTKTEHRRERDDEIAVIVGTKTGVPRESDPEGVGDDTSADEDPTRLLLALVTKTMAGRERDDDDDAKP